MPHEYTADELMEMQAVYYVVSEKMDEDENVSPENLQDYLFKIYKFQEDNTIEWTKALDSSNENESYRPVAQLNELQQRLEEMVAKNNTANFEAYNHNPVNTVLDFSAKQEKYENTIPQQYRSLIYKGDYQRIIDTICAKHESEYKKFNDDAVVDRDKKLQKYEGMIYDKELAEYFERNEERKELIQQKNSFIENMKYLDETANKKKAKEVDTRTLQRETGITEFEERIATLESKLVREFYEQKDAENDAAKQEIMDTFTNSVNNKFKELDEAINNEVSETLQAELTKKQQERENRLQALDKDISDRVQKLKKGQERDVNQLAEDLEKAEVKPEVPKEEVIDNKVEEPAPKEEVIDNKVEESALKKEEPKHEEPKKEEPKKEEPKLKSLLKKSLTSERMNEVEQKVIRFADGVNAKDFSGITGYKAAMDREKRLVERDFSKDKDSFRLGKDDHFNRINGIHRILKNNKKSGFSSDSNEYKAVISSLDEYKKGLIEKGWYDVVLAEKRGEKLTSEQLRLKAEMLDQLDTVYNNAANYMEIKGPEKKFWGHGQARYELMYLLCNEIHSEGGYVADTRARLKRVNDEIQAGKARASTYTHQISSPSKDGERLFNKYSAPINEAMNGRGRNIGTIDELANKVSEAKGEHNNLIVPENRIPNGPMPKM